jgi:hypothetical protein
MPWTEINYVCDHKGCGLEVHVGRYCDLHDPVRLEEERRMELEPEEAWSMIDEE